MSEKDHPASVSLASADIDGAASALDRIRRFNPSFTLAFLKNSPDSVSVLSSSGTIEYMNENGLALLGFDRSDDIVGLPWDSLWPADTRATVLDAVQSAAQGERRRYTALLGYLNAPEMCCDITLCPLTSPQGRVDALLAIIRAQR